jgi:hypothetical protein
LELVLMVAVMAAQQIMPVLLVRQTLVAVEGAVETLQETAEQAALALSLSVYLTT